MGMTPQVAMITGANRGLGREAATQLAGIGYHVLVGSRQAESGQAVAGELTAAGLSATAVAIDVTDSRSVLAAAQTVEREHGRLDVLVNNAGALVETSAAQLTAAELRKTCEVNLFGVANAVHEMLPPLRRSPNPRIVNVSSTTGSLSLTAAGTDFGGDAASRIAYSTSKAALNMLTLQYARAFAADPELAHIKINAVTPGYIATDMNQGRGTRTVAQGVRVVVDLATIDRDGPSGEFRNDQGPVAW